MSEVKRYFNLMAINSRHKKKCLVVNKRWFLRTQIFEFELFSWINLGQGPF